MRHCLSGFPGRQSLIHELHRKTNCARQSLRECLRFRCHFASLAADVQRIADDNTRNPLLSAGSPQAVEVLSAILALNGLERPGNESEFV
jgi:hypothetical protein